LSKSILIKIDDEKYGRLQRIRKAYRVNVNRSGFIERVLMAYALAHFDDAFREWGERGSERVEFRRQVAKFLEAVSGPEDKS